jgi:plasmid stabilization system protein ParE
MRVVYTGQARAELRQIGEWIGRDSPRRAASFLEELRARCRSLTTFPGRFPVVKRIEGVETRRCVHGDYIILFSVATELDAVVILHVAHAARDYNRLFGPPRDNDN